MASQSFLSQGGWSLRPVLGLAAVAMALSLAVGCQSEGELAHTKNGVGGALAPVSVDEYARQHRISPEQARQELQQKVGERDAEEAIEKIEEIGTKTP